MPLLLIPNRLLPINRLAFGAFALALCAICLAACSKEGGTTDPDPKPVKTNPPAGTMETSTLYGRILDEGGAPLEGVKVTAESKSSVTDADGFFLLSEAQVPKGRAVILASKAGYYDGARAEIPGVGARTRFELKMMKKEFSHSVSAADGGKVEVADGASVEFQGGGFRTESGDAYTGTVKVAARYLNPDSSSFYEFFSGDNQGWGADAEYAALVSVGVLRVDMQGSAGQTLKLADGKEASLTYPKASTVSGPDKIPLWYFDPEIGQWREEGSASLQGGVYVGEVSHFSDWNLDHKGPSWSFCVTVTCGGKPVSGVRIRTYQRTGTTDSAGSICVNNAPADEAANTVEVNGYENAGRYFTNEPLVVTVQKDAKERPRYTLELDSECPGTVEGAVVGCGGESLEAMVYVAGKGGKQYVYTHKGRFSLNVAPDTGLTLMAKDAAGNLLKTPIDIDSIATGDKKDLGKLAICGSDSTDTTGYFDITVDGADSFIAWGMSPDVSRIAARAPGGDLVVYDAKSGAVTGRMPWAVSGGRVAFSQDNKRMLLQPSSGDSVEVWDVSETAFKRLSVIRPAAHAEFTEDGKTVFAASRAGSVSRAILYSAESGEVQDTLHPTDFVSPTGFGGVRGMHLMHEENALVYLVQKGGAGIFRVWSLAQDTLVREIPTKLQASVLSDYIVDFSASGRIFWVQPDFRTTSVFDAKTGEALRVIRFQDFPGAFIGPGTAYLPGVISEQYFFRPVKIGADPVIQKIDFRDSTVAAVLPLPKVATQSGVLAHPDRSGKTMGALVRQPSLTKSSFAGFRIYKLD